MDNIKSLQRKLIKLEKELEKVRGCSPITDGWQTKKYASKARKWDELAKEKFLILQKLEEYGVDFE